METRRLLGWSATISNLSLRNQSWTYSGKAASASVCVGCIGAAKGWGSVEKTGRMPGFVGKKHGGIVECARNGADEGKPVFCHLRIQALSFRLPIGPPRTHRRVSPPLHSSSPCAMPTSPLHCLRRLMHLSGDRLHRDAYRLGRVGDDSHN